MVVVPSCGRAGPGHDAFVAGRFDEAAAAIDEALTRERVPTLLLDKAVVALHRGRWAAADAAAAEAAAADATLAPAAAFMRGHVSFARSFLAEAAAAARPEDVRARQDAIVLTEDALARWIVAATSRRDWPAARRNVARAKARLRSLREQRGGRPAPRPGAGTRPGPSPEAPDTGDPPDAPPGGGTPGAEDPAVEATALSEARVLQLLEILAAKRADQRRVRAARRRAVSKDVERDW